MQYIHILALSSHANNTLIFNNSCFLNSQLTFFRKFEFCTIYTDDGFPLFSGQCNSQNPSNHSPGLRQCSAKAVTDNHLHPYSTA